jgi:hypothetical protein
MSGKPINDASISEITNPSGDEQIPLNNGGVDATIKIKNILAGGVDSITFNPDPPVITADNTIFWNNQEYTLNIITGLGATIQVGQELLMLYYNDTGAQIDNFTTLHPKSAIDIAGLVVPTPEKADASKWELCEGTLAIATHDIPNGELGFATRFGKARGGNSSGWTPGSQLWLSANGSGLPTITKPVFPNFSISLGGSLKEHASEGEIFVSITKSVADTFHDSWDGAIRETFNFTVDSDGAIVTGLLANVNPLDNLTIFFSDGAVFYTLDTTTSPLTIALTAGTDEATISNFVYIPISTKVLTVSTSGFPVTEHCRIAVLEVQSAATVQTENGTRRNQNINDHIKKEDDNGHILHITERIRVMNAEWDSGTEASLTGTTTNGYVSITGGLIWQLHKQAFPSISMSTGDSALIVNDFTTAYRKTTNLNTIDAYSDGSTWNNDWSNIIVWGVINKTGEPSYLMANLPSNGYNSEANAIADGLNYTDYSIPNQYKGVGFLIARFTVRISGGTITYNSGVGYKDLRGFFPNNTAGGGSGAGGVTSLLALDDVFITDYADKAGELVIVNDLETGIESTDSIQTFKSFLDGAHIDDSGLGKRTPSAGTVLSIQSSSGPALEVLGAGASFSGDIFNIKCNTVAATFYSFLKAIIDDDGTPITAFNLRGVGALILGVSPTLVNSNNALLSYNESTGVVERSILKTSQSITTGSSVIPTGNYQENEQYVTALSSNFIISPPSGTALNGNTLVIRIYAAGVRTLTWNAIYKDFTGSLPAATIAGKELYVGCAYNSRSSKWDVLSVILEP